MNNIKAKNHYVPQLYLRQWEDSEKKVCIYKTLISHENESDWRRKSTDAIAYQRHFYTQLIAGNESDDFEEWLDKKYESPAQSAIHRAITDKKLSKNDWHLLISFLACQDVRTPARLLEYLDRQNRTYKDLLQNTLEKFVEGLKNNSLPFVDAPISKNEFDDLLPLKVKTEVDPNDSEMAKLKIESYSGRATWLHSIKYLLTYTEKVLHKHKWTIIKPALGYSWPTSDNPVIKLNFRDENDYDFHSGWDTKNGNIFFPLGPQHAMFVEIGSKPIMKGTRMNEFFTKQVRKFIVKHAHRAVFSNSYDSEIVLLRPRVVNSELVKSERHQLNQWHEQNVRLEAEFQKNDIPIDT